MNAIGFLTIDPPAFAPGHTLPPLTHCYGGQPSVETQAALARWGYALFADGKAAGMATSQDAKLAKLHLSDPTRYPLCTYVPRVSQITALCQQMPASAWCHDATGKRLPMWKPWLDAISLATQSGLVRGYLQPLADLGVTAPFILHQGEDWIPAVGCAKAYWRQDPAVAASLDKLGEWRKLHAIFAGKRSQEIAVRQACYDVLPGATGYAYYVTHPVTSNWQTEWDMIDWGASARYMRDVTPTLSTELYHTPWATGTFTSTPRNLVLAATNAAGAAQRNGQPYQYHWVSPGWWADPANNADLDRYRGYLNLCYMLGMLGACPFIPPKPSWNVELGTTEPYWLTAYKIHGYAHAEWSWREDWLRNGDLLPGDGTHPWGANWPQPSYLYDAGDTGVIVAARRMGGRYLILAWARAGEDRDATATIPGLGRVTVRATRTGDVEEMGVLSADAQQADANNPCDHILVFRGTDDQGLYGVCAECGATARIAIDQRIAWEG